MVDLKNLVAAQQFMTRELTSIGDELFGLLYHDVGGFASKRTSQIFDQGRRISIYGVRGVGKTTTMQGMLWHGLAEGDESNVIPITVTVKGAMSAQSLRELEDAFYRSIVAGILQTAEYKTMKSRLRGTARRYAPWIARKITEASSLIFPPLALASEIAEESIRWLVRNLGQQDIQRILTSTTIDIRQSSETLINRLEEKGLIPIFVIDELDKVIRDTLLSDFFDGNQSWFQGRRGVISLTYTFGESVKEAVASSVRRISTVEVYPGITNEEDAARIIHSRTLLGISQIQKDETATKSVVEEIFSEETIKAILNVSAPNTYLMLERAYEALTKAIETRSPTVQPKHVIEEEKEIIVPTDLEFLILSELSKGRLTPSDISERLEKKSSSIVRSLSRMMKKNWVTRVGAGKRAYYSLTAKGDSALRRYITKENS
jgi:predicted transcriptional regulator